MCSSISKLSIDNFQNLNPITQQEIISVIFGGGQNSAESIVPKLNASEKVGFIQMDSKIVSIAAIKRPDVDVRKSVFARAGSDLNFNQIIYEIGFFVTLSSLRGKGLLTDILNKLLDQYSGNNMYALVNRPNPTVLSNYGFRQSGEPFVSRYNAERLYLMVKLVE